MDTQLRLRAVVAVAALVLSAVLVPALRANEPPVVTSVLPVPLVTSPKPQVLKVAGSGFLPGLTVEITTQGQTEIFSGASIQGQNRLAFEISVVLVQAGTATLVVRNTDGGVSEPFALTITAGPPPPPPPVPASPPVVDRVSPDKTTRGSVAQVLTLSGRNFAPGLSVTVTDPTGTETILRGTAIEAVSPTTVRVRVVLDISGDYTCVVTNPLGEASNPVTVVVT